MLFFLLLVLFTVVLAFVPGLGLLAIVPAILAVLYLVWLVAVVASGHGPGWALRRTRRGRLLGPGGPDDPDRGR